MLEYLADIDKALFLFLNVKLANPVTDLIMPVVTSDMVLRVLYALAMLLLLWKGDAKTRWLVLFSALVLLVTDQVSSSLLKPWFDRPRPCHVLENINLLVGCGGGRALPSSHAANAFGQALLFAVCFPRIRIYLLSFAAIIAISRVFVGVHYPGDIFVGALLGSVAGAALAIVYKISVEQQLKVKSNATED